MNNVRNPIPAMLANRGKIFTYMIIGSLLAFELFNYGTTDYSLKDVLGNLTFLGMRWSTILAFAFCAIDFGGIARLFTPEEGDQEPTEVWYLFGAWVLAAIMNAILTWWGVAVAIASNTSAMQSASVVSRQNIQDIVPIFVAVMVFIIRVIVIGTLSVSADKGRSQVRQSRPAQQVVPPRPIQTGQFQRPDFPNTPARGQYTQIPGLTGAKTDHRDKDE